MSASAARMDPKPVQTPHVPIVVGGHKKRSLRRAAQYGNGWYGFRLTPEQLKPILEKLDVALEQVGRTRDGYRILVTPTDEDEGNHRSICRTWSRSIGPTVGVTETTQDRFYDYLSWNLMFASQNRLVRQNKYYSQSPLQAGVAHAEVKIATFAGGCFWCGKDFDHVPGVVKTISGYTGARSRPHLQNCNASGAVTERRCKSTMTRTKFRTPTSKCSGAVWTQQTVAVSSATEERATRPQSLCGQCRA